MPANFISGSTVSFHAKETGAAAESRATPVAIASSCDSDHRMAPVTPIGSLNATNVSSVPVGTRIGAATSSTVTGSSSV